MTTTTIASRAGNWSLLTDNVVTALTFQVMGPNPGYIKATEDANPPSGLDGAFLYQVGQGEQNMTLADVWLGLTPTHVWVWAEAGTRVAVSHA